MKQLLTGAALAAVLSACGAKSAAKPKEAPATTTKPPTTAAAAPATTVPPTTVAGSGSASASGSAYASGSGSAAAAAPLTPAPCRFALTTASGDTTTPLPGLTEGQTIKCGDATVPLHRGGTDGQTIKIHYAEIYPAAGSAMDKAPIVVHQGGPGTTGEGIVAAAVRLADGTGRNVLAIAQRGTYFSSPIEGAHCAGAGDTEGPKQACVDDLNAQGLVPAMTTKASVDDYMEIVTALGYDKIVAFGISYGTFFMARLAADYPDRVEHLIIDSVLTLDLKEFADGSQLLESAKIVDKTLRRAFDSVCAAQADTYGLCPRQFATAGSGVKLWATVEEASAALAKYLGEEPTDLPSAHEAFGRLMFIAQYQPLPEMILQELAGAVKGDLASRKIAAESRLRVQDPGFQWDVYAGAEGKSTERQFSPLAFVGIACNDVFRVVDKAKAHAVSGDKTAALHVADALIDDYYSTCPEGLHLSATPDALGSVPAGVKTLVVNSATDSSTPAPAAQRFAATIPGSLYVETDCGGHAVFSGAPDEAATLAGILDGSLATEAAIRSSLCDPVAKAVSLVDRKVWRKVARHGRWSR